MTARAPSTKVETIKRSMRCFYFGLFGLAPLFGIPFAIAALVNYRRVWASGAVPWNPAQRYLRWGGLCARFGLTAFFIIPAILLLFAYFLNLLQ